MALKYDRDTQRRPAEMTDYPAGVDVIYRGAMVTVLSGYAYAGQAVAGHRFVGVAEEQCDNSAGCAGGKVVRVWRSGEFLFDVSGTLATQADIGKRVFLASDDKVTLTRPAGAVVVGELRGIEASGAQAWIDIRPATQESQSLLAALRGSLTAATNTNGGAVLSLANPFGERVVVLDVILDVTTKSTGAATVDAGIAADGTTAADTLIDGLDVGTAAIIGNNIDSKGTHGGRALAWGASECITATASATLAGMVGTYTVVCALATAR
jgi:hypothetical protein